MKIQFRSVRCMNFLSFGNEWTELKLDAHSTSVIMGTNGTGKSSIIIDTICYALFKRTFKKLIKEQLPNSITKKKCVVELEFDIAPDSYKIIRGIKPDVFEIYKNGDLLNQPSDTRDYQKILEKQIIRMNFTTFCQVVIIGSTKYVPFMLLTGPKRREVTEELTDLQVFSGMTAVLKTKLTNNDEQVRLLLNEKELVEEKIKLIKGHQTETKISNETLISDKLERVSETEIQINIYLADIDLYQEKCRELEETITDHSTTEGNIEKYESLSMQLRNKKDNCHKEIHFLEENDNCPVCKQMIAEDFKNETLEEKRKKHTELSTAIETLKTKINNYRERLQEINKVNRQVADIGREIMQKTMQINAWKDYIKDTLKEIELIKNQKVVDFDGNKIKDQEKRLTKIGEEYNVLIDEKNYLKAALSQLPSIKGKQLKKYIPIINQQINKYLAALEFYVNFALDENFEETIKSNDRDKFTYHSFSEGEQSRINLAILFAWRAVAKIRNSVSCSILIMDEILDSALDDAGVSDFIKILKNMESGINTFIISHKSEETFDQFDRIIRLTKDRNFSKILEEV